jgi:hypothetical protein
MEIVMTNYAKLSPINKALLSDDFGLSYAIRLFGQEAVDSIPVFQKGKNAGKKKGVLHWINADVGGWTREYGAVTPGLVRAWISLYSGSFERDAIEGMWLGRVQMLAAGRYYLGDVGRANYANDQAVIAADHAAALAAADKRDAEREEDSLVGLDAAALNALADADEYRRDLY